MGLNVGSERTQDFVFPHLPVGAPSFYVLFQALKRENSDLNIHYQWMELYMT